MNSRYSCKDECKNWGIPEPKSECPAAINFVDTQKLGPFSTDCCTCTNQGVNRSGFPSYGYFKPIPLPYVNYRKDEQRSPYDNYGIPGQQLIVFPPCKY